MNKYNERWTREKFIEYRKLKREGYTDRMLIEHFGEDIYHSGLYNRKSSIMPWLRFITEIKITPEKVNYDILERKSDIYPNKIDYVISFENEKVCYIISLFYYVISGIETYNILLTTKKQWDDYLSKLELIRDKGYITETEREDLVNIVEKETGFHQLYGVMRKISYIIFDFFKDNSEVIISIGETKNPVKINLYRNIIKNSFVNVEEIGDKLDNAGNKYYLYKI
jgi:hypothetical protein